jgi:hypothetical protein
MASILDELARKGKLSFTAGKYSLPTKSSGQIQVYRIEYVPKNEASPNARNELGL